MDTFEVLPKFSELKLTTSVPWMWLSAIVGLYVMLEFVFGTNQAPKEPRLAKTSIPYFGHTLGLLRHKMGYYVHLSKENRDPIYAVSMMGGKVYVANQPELVQAIYRDNKTLSFANLAAEVVARLSMVSKQTKEILCHNIVGDDGPTGYSQEGYKGMHAALAPGMSLDKINASIIPDVAACIDKLDPGMGGRKRVRLYEWVRHTITFATSNAVYGPQNPFVKDENYKAFWDFENNLTVLLLGILPWLFRPSAYRGRSKLRTAFSEYFAAGHQKHGSDLVKVRHEVSVRNGVSDLDTAGLEVTMSIGVLANTAPSGFWTVWYTFAHEAVLKGIRAEVEAITTISVDAAGEVTRCIDLKRIRAECPLLVSTWHEVLRHIGCGTSARLIREDMTLSNQYFLRKNNVIQMPSQVVHSRPELWNSDSYSKAGSANAPEDAQSVHAFDAWRFINAKPIPGAYRPFGGGITLCPGRHLSATEVQALVALMVMRFDMKPVDSAGWVKPESYLTSFASAILSPRQDPLVDIMQRKGWEGGKWTFTVPESRY